jgi:hypothetical protein
MKDSKEIMEIQEITFFKIKRERGKEKKRRLKCLRNAHLIARPTKFDDDDN